LSNVVAISVGSWQTVALRADGTVAAFANSDQLAGTNLPPGLSDVVAISSGDYNTLALKADGTIVAWGVYRPQLMHVPDEATNIIAVAAGFYQNFALRADGTVIGWGDGGPFLPFGSTTRFVDIAAGPDVVLGLTTDGRVLSGPGDGLAVTNALEISPA